MMDASPRHRPMLGKGFARETTTLRRVMHGLGYMIDGDVMGEGGTSFRWQSTLVAWTMTVVAINVAMSFYAMTHVSMARDHLQSWLEPSVMGALLTGIKPIRNVVSLCVFAFYAKEHRVLLRSLASADRAMAEQMAWRRSYRRSSSTVLGAMGITFSVIAIGRVFEMTYIWPFVRDSPASNTDIAFFLSSAVIAPLLSVWQLTPLFYFTFLSFTLAAMFAHLKKHMKSRGGSSTSTDYFRWYMRLTRGSEALAAFSTVYLFVSLAFSVLIVCLAVYYVIHADAMTNIQSGADHVEFVLACTEAGWASLQVMVAVAYVVCITIGGLTVNERARTVISSALSCHVDDEFSRFNITRFMSRLHTQHTCWGITIWRALPVERGLLFTLFGLISTYAVLLLKLQGATDGKSCTNSSISSSPSTAERVVAFML